MWGGTRSEPTSVPGLFRPPTAAYRGTINFLLASFRFSSAYSPARARAAGGPPAGGRPGRPGGPRGRPGARAGPSG